MKICSTCKLEKTPEEFTKDRGSPDGLHCYCKLCSSIRANLNYKKNKEAILKRQSEILKERRRDDPEFREKLRKIAKACNAKRKEYTKAYQELHKDKLREYNRKRREEKREHIAKVKAEYRLNNLDKEREVKAHKRAQKRQATPKWMTKSHRDEIKKIYKQARELEKVTGLKYHVDHIVPLISDEVCGLHLPWKLRPLESKANMSKGNKLIKE